MVSGKQSCFVALRGFSDWILVNRHDLSRFLFQVRSRMYAKNQEMH